MRKDFLTLLDLTAQELNDIIDRAFEYKAGKAAPACPLLGKSIGIYFEKASTRTRISFQTGIYELGAHAIYINPNELQLGRGETIEDTARVLSRYLHGFVMRTFAHEKLESFAHNATIPVINGLTDLHHPCQALADLMTIKEKKGRLKDIHIVYVGDGNNVANSLIEAAVLTGINLVLACPRGYEADDNVYKNALSGGANVTIVADPVKAMKGADVVYTDVWISMGQDEGAEKKKKAFKSYQLNKKLLSHAKSDTIIMHCLPAHRGEEITDEIIDSDRSVVFDQAENRLHTQKALLEALIK
ncbi:MAG: ornithine carbamoyltransferase [Thermodesulfovibrionia bacterium]|nr:ornithine carbamoyltransferase [Thermodesulfovibrionia bacterium]